MLFLRKRTVINYLSGGREICPFIFRVDKQEFLIYNISRNGNPAPNSVLLMKRKCVPFLFSFIHKGNLGNRFPFLYASFVKAPAGRALEEVARLVVTEGLIFHKNMENLWNFQSCKIGKSSQSGSYFIWKVFYLIISCINRVLY